MRLTRRDWLKSLLALPIAATLDVEQLLWVPKPIITVPTLPTLPTMLEIDAIVRAQFLPGIVDNYFKECALLKYLRDRQPDVWWHGQFPIQENVLYKAQS